MSAAGAGSSGTGSSRLVKAGSFGSTSSSSTPLSLVSWSRTSSACSSVRASTPCSSRRSSSLVTQGTRRQAGCCQLDIQPYIPPRHFIGTPTRTLSLAINSLHLRGSKRKGKGSGTGQTRGDLADFREDAGVDLALTCDIWPVPTLQSPRRGCKSAHFRTRRASTRTFPRTPR